MTITNSKRADIDAMDSLHSKLAEVLKKHLENGEVDPETGVALPPSAAILNVARQFLKDNKIESIPVKGSALGQLADLPVFDEDGNVYPLPARKAAGA